MVRYGDGGPDPYCGCESCFSYWLQTFADGRPDGFDLYWEECPTDPPGIRPTSGEQAVRRWWQEGTLGDGFDVYYEETLYGRASDWMRPLRGLPWP